MFFFFLPYNNDTANLVLQENLVILLQDQMNQFAKIALMGSIKAPRQALNVLLVQMECLAMLLDKQPYLHAKIVAKEHIWINLDNQNVRTALLDNLEIWKQQQQLEHAKNVQPAKTNRHQDNLNATHAILGITKMKTPKRIVCRAYPVNFKIQQVKIRVAIVQ